MSRWRGNGGIIGASTARDYSSTSNDSDGVWGLESKYNLQNEPPYGTADLNFDL